MTKRLTVALIIPFDIGQPIDFIEGTGPGSVMNLSDIFHSRQNLGKAKAV